MVSTDTTIKMNSACPEKNLQKPLQIFCHVTNKCLQIHIINLKDMSTTLFRLFQQGKLTLAMDAVEKVVVIKLRTFRQKQFLPTINHIVDNSGAIRCHGCQRSHIIQNIWKIRCRQAL